MANFNLKRLVGRMKILLLAACGHSQNKKYVRIMYEFNLHIVYLTKAWFTACVLI